MYNVLYKNEQTTVRKAKDLVCLCGSKRLVYKRTAELLKVDVVCLDCNEKFIVDGVAEKTDTPDSEYPHVVCKPSNCSDEHCYYGCVNQDKLEFLGRIEKQLGDKAKYGHQYRYSFSNAENNHAPFPSREGFWSSEQPIPNIGSRVRINFNGFGEGTVVGYFFEGDYIGIEVHVDRRPDWHIKQCKERKHPLVFGAEVTVL